MTNHNKNIDWLLFQKRAAILRSIRSYFDSQGFLEVESPILTPYPTLDANILSMKSVLNLDHRHTLFLHTSPEHTMKKLLAAGAGNIYYLGKVFRDGELTDLHNPEFTMAEWYRTDATYEDIIQDTQNLIVHVAQDVFGSTSFDYDEQPIDLSPAWDRTTLTDLFLEKTGISLPDCYDLSDFKKTAADHGFRVQSDDDWESLFFRIYLEKVEPGLGIPKPLFITDYPARMGLMARRKANDLERVERVELYIGGLELANGYTELLDPDEQKERFLEQLMKKEDAGFQEYRIDEELLEALPAIPSPTAGIALGVDRLIMLLTNKSDIWDVILFPLHDIQKESG